MNNNPMNNNFNNMLNQMMIKQMVDNLYFFYKNNQMILFKFLPQMNQIVLEQFYKKIQEENNKKQIKKHNQIINDFINPISEYETIDTETNPLNKYVYRKCNKYKLYNEIGNFRTTKFKP